MSLYLIKPYTRALKIYDRDLFAEKNRDGVSCVFRKVKRWVEIYVSDEFKFMSLTEGKQFVFAITDTWNLSGRPIDWGIDDVVGRIQRIDALANQRFYEELDAQNEQADKIKSKDLRNEMEAFWSHERRRFAKATDDILTHSLSKDEPKKRLRDKRIKNANY